MANRNRNPLNFQGATTNSGNMGNTGQSTWTQGGGQAFSRQSGVVAATLLTSGPGRLDSIAWLSPFASGQGVVFYDSNTATSGGPFQTSGHNVLGVLPPSNSLPVSILSGQPITPAPTFLGSPFTAGLCVAPFPGLVSGMGSFYGTYTAAGLWSGGGGIGPENGQAP